MDLSNCPSTSTDPSHDSGLGTPNARDLTDSETEETASIDEPKKSNKSLKNRRQCEKLLLKNGPTEIKHWKDLNSASRAIIRNGQHNLAASASLEHRNSGRLNPLRTENEVPVVHVHEPPNEFKNRITALTDFAFKRNICPRQSLTKSQPPGRPKMEEKNKKKFSKKTEKEQKLLERNRVNKKQSEGRKQDKITGIVQEIDNLEEEFNTFKIRVPRLLSEIRVFVGIFNRRLWALSDEELVEAAAIEGTLDLLDRSFGKILHRFVFRLLSQICVSDVENAEFDDGSQDETNT